jgi:hypothetical protein
MTKLKDIGEDTIANTHAVFLPSEPIFLPAMRFKAVASIHKKNGQVDWIEVWNAVRES